MSIKKLSFILAILFFIMPFSIFSYASKVPTKSEGKYPPLKFAAKYGDSVYINKTEDHNFMVIGNKTIPIRIKYFYIIKNMLLFLGEDSTLYLSDNKAANIKILLKDVNAAVISDEKGDYAYAVNKKGELYRVTVESKKTEKIENNVINLYSAWSDWVVYQTSDKKWWKHILNKEPVQIGHKSSQTSPYIPDSQKNFAVIGPWRIFGNSHSVFMDHHGGQDLYEDYTAILLENKDGISGGRELRDYDDHYPFNVQAILGNNENDIYIIFEEGYPEPIGLNIAHIKSTETEKISFSSGSKLNYNLIYNKQTNSKDIFPQYYRNSYGIYILYKNSIEFISFEGDKALSLFQSNGELSYIKSKTGELYIKEIKKETIVKFKLNPESSSLEKVNSIPDISDDIPQKKSITENTLYKSTTKNKDQKKTSVFMGDGVWLYSKGAINAVYTIDKNLYIFRNGKATLIKSFCDFYSSEVLRNSVFSLDGWIYINIRDSCFRFQPDNPQKLQEMNYEFGSPVFDNQSVIGFYKDSLCKFTWNSSKLDSIKKINNPYKCSNVIVTKDRYVYYNESDECIESVSKSGKDFKTISGKLPVIIRPGEFSPQIWENSGCIYFQSGTFNTLYSVLPNGKSLSEVVDSTCTPLCISNGKIYCDTYGGLLSIDNTGTKKLVIDKHRFKNLVKGYDPDNISFINVEASANKIFFSIVQNRLYDGDEDGKFGSDVLVDRAAFSFDIKNKRLVKLPFANVHVVIDSWYYFINNNGKICRIDLDGKNLQPIL